MDEFESGVFYSAFLLCEMHDQPTYAADIIREAGLDGRDISELDDCERAALMALNDSEKLSLTCVIDEGATHD